MAQIRVKLNKKIAAKRGGFVDPANGVMISARKYDKSGSQVVERTNFVQVHINSGELLEVQLAELKKSEATEVEVTFLADVKVGKESYKAGDKANLPADLAAKLKESGKVE